MTAAAKPKNPISHAIFSSFIYNGVKSLPPEVNISYILPIEEFFPTLITIIVPFPVNTFVPAINITEGMS